MKIPRYKLTLSVIKGFEAFSSEREKLTFKAQHKALNNLRRNANKQLTQPTRFTWNSFHLANSAVRQLFPAKSPPSALTQETLKAFDESKRGGNNLLTASQTITSGGSASSTSTSPTPLTHSASDTDTIKRTIERNALRRSLIKYEPK